MKSFLLTIVVLGLLSAINNLKAQSNYEDVVYLKTGSIIHGMIIEQIPNVSIKIQTKDQNVFVYKMDEIEKITKEVVQSQISKKNTPSFSDEDIKRSGYTFIPELSFGFGIGNINTDVIRDNKNLTSQTAKNTDFSYGVQLINGYQFSPKVSLGIGIGIDKYKNIDLAPLFGDVRINFLKRKFTPFLIAAGGYSFSLTVNNKGGLHLNPSLGGKIFLAPKFALNFSLGYKLERNSYDGSETINIITNGAPLFVTRYYHYIQTSSFINLKTGVTF